MPVAAYEIYKELEESFSRTGSQAATAQYNVPWIDRHQFVIDQLSGPGALYPNWPNALTGPRADDVKIRPMGDLDEGVYGSALCTVTYKFNGVETADDGTIFSINTSPFSEFVTLNPDFFRWTGEDGDPLEDEEAAGKLMKGTRYSITYYKVQNIPAEVENLVGKVNANTWRTPRGKVLDPETLLYAEPKIAQSFTADGSSDSTVTLNLVHKPEGWNVFFRTSKLRFERLYFAGDGQQWDNYELAAFPKLRSAA